jgi:hypothetical protein
MGSKIRKKAPKKPKPPEPSKRRGIFIAIAAVAAMAAVAVSVGLLVQRQSGAKAPSSTGQQADENAPGKRVKVLEGKWLRPDGGYVLEIKGAYGDGRLLASYHNPASIHVSEARSTLEGDTLKVFVKLDDTNYPGCTYTLAYDPDEDALTGIYYQAMLQQNYAVVFQRTK